ncbi:hypothetical protein [Oceanobacillus salinisoli]|uniref:hypothetical protein n=1 Tax=Oceanobacillus salinisoli TaxID=2678611 RepID=UPI0012E29982|nr:hypothetical protein [Oceanobacillus salinisoli]
MKQTKKIDFEFVHDEFYGIALEVSKKFIQKGDTRPLLNYTQHRSNGDLVATDSHRLIHIKDIHGFKEDFLVSPKTFMFAKGKFPETDKISSRENHKKSIVLDKVKIKLWLQIFKSINQTMKIMKDYNKVVRFNFNEESVEVELKELGIIMQLPTNEYTKIKDLDVISYNPEYLRDALEAHFKLNSEELTIYFRGNMTPFILDDNERVRTLILPVRTY